MEIPANIAAELEALRLANERTAAAIARTAAAQRAMERRLERSTTDATDIGYGVRRQVEWAEDHTQGILDCLGPPIKSVHITAQQLAAALPSTFKEAAALELEARAKKQVALPRVKRPWRARYGALDPVWQEEAAKAERKEQEAQLGMGWLLRKLHELLPALCWHGIDCSVSGISGHGDRVSYGFFKENGKFITQLLTMVEVKDLFARSNAVKAEALGRLVARGEAVFRKQPGRSHVVGAAVARDSVDVIVMHLDGRVWHTNHSSFTMGQVCDGLVWLLRLLLATPAAMGFRSTVPPVIPALSSGHTVRDMRLVFSDSGPTAATGESDAASAAPSVRPTRVYKATAVSAGREKDVAVKVSSLQQIDKEVSKVR